ncbi:dTMP kinase [Shewanella xiamenensis]|uniref:dTMP kinase n=1 Tax=Shewanella xiamenensis TaxID=332186 RepID=UPI001CC446E4|nr:hypothetical protein [Shewanella xiamenensis]BDA61692.1 hypothetical protein NUITMVS1_31550 [Shewanella xiamenensis]
MPGKFIVITGLDGSGTSSIGQKLAEMDENGYYLQTPEGVFSEYREQFTQALRDSDPEAHYLYYLASVVKASNEIKKKLKSHNVYCVRFLIDTVVSHRAMGVDVDLVYDLGFANIVKPDLILYVDVNENIRQQRITERGKSILDKKLDDKEFRDRFQAEFSRFVSQISIIDNSTSLEECLSIAKKQVDALLSKKSDSRALLVEHYGENWEALKAVNPNFEKDFEAVIKSTKDAQLKVARLRKALHEPSSDEIAHFLGFPDEMKNLNHVGDETLCELLLMQYRAKKLNQRYAGKIISGSELADLADRTAEYISLFDIRQYNSVALEYRYGIFVSLDFEKIELGDELENTTVRVQKVELCNGVVKNSFG